MCCNVDTRRTSTAGPVVSRVALYCAVVTELEADQLNACATRV